MHEIGIVRRMFAQIAFRMQRDEKLRSVFGGYLNKDMCDYIRYAEQALDKVYSPVDKECLRKLKQEIRELSQSPAKV